MGGYTKSRVIGRLSLGTSAKGREAMASLRRSATSSPKLSVIRSVAEALDVTIGDLVGELTLLEWNSESGTKTVSALREALLNYRQLSPFAQPAAGGAPDINQLTTAVGSLYSPVLPTRTPSTCRSTDSAPGRLGRSGPGRGPQLGTAVPQRGRRNGPQNPARRANRAYTRGGRGNSALTKQKVLASSAVPQTSRPERAAQAAYTTRRAQLWREQRVLVMSVRLCPGLLSMW
jgi:hypothetical protein